MSLLTPGPTGASVDGGWLATITRVDSAGPYVTAPRLQRGYEYGPCQAPALTPGEPPYAAGDRVIVNAYEGRPDELIIVARTTTTADAPPAPVGPHEHDAADVTSGVLDAARIPPLHTLDGTLVANQVPDLSDLNGALVVEQLPAAIPASRVSGDLDDATIDGANITGTVAIERLAMATPPITRHYLASGTWTKPARLLALRVVLVGGGGAGGGRAAAAGSASPGAGGGAGGYIEAILPASSLPESAPIVVGAAGAGVSGGNGQAGGPSSAFGITAAGGNGGATGTGATNTSFTFTGGTGGGGTGLPSGVGFFVPGQDGQGSFWNGTIVQGEPGGGGDCPLGAGGQAAKIGQTGQRYAGTGYGAGGSGVLGVGQAAAPGAPGAPGTVILTEIYG